MARIRSYAGNGKTAFFLFLLCAILVSALSLFIGLGSASGAAEANGTTLGVGQKQRTQETSETFNAAEKLGIAESANGAESLTQASQRNVATSATGPVVELVAVDLGDAATIKAAAEIGVLNPAKETKRKAIDTSGEDWLVGQASGYDVESSSTLTRSGRTFDDDCVTVAVPEGMEDLLGHPVVIVYENKVVVATVTDTGGFAKYGRALDLGGGVFKAFGYEDIWDWGVREVEYKFL